MLNAFMKELRSIPDNDRQAVEAALQARAPIPIGWLAFRATSMLADRPRLAFRIFAWIASQDAPRDRADHWEWLRAHDNACHLATLYGEDDERRAIVQRALHVAADANTAARP